MADFFLFEMEPCTPALLKSVALQTSHSPPPDESKPRAAKQNSSYQGLEAKALQQWSLLTEALQWRDDDAPGLNESLSTESYTSSSFIPLGLSGTPFGSSNSISTLAPSLASSLSVSSSMGGAGSAFSSTNSLNSMATRKIPLPESHNQVSTELFHSKPTLTRMVSAISLNYNNTPNLTLGGDANLLLSIMANTPRPKGRDEFTTIHVIAPPKSALSKSAEKIVFNLQSQAKSANKECVVHRLLDVSSSQEPMDEYNTVFDVASNLVLKKADRTSLIVFVGWEDASMDFYGAMIAMLPFRGVHLALITQRKSYGDLFDFKSRSGVFRIEGKNAGRMGMFPVQAVFGPLPDKSFSTSIDDWKPVDIEPYLEHEDQVNHPTVNLPFKIGALTLPMLTHNGSYEYSLASLKDLLKNHYKSTGFFPIVSCGETCDALGYGTDILEALKSDKDLCPAGGYYFHHKSGETYKCFENYGTEELFKQVALAKAKNVPLTVIAVGGGVNGNCIGLIAGLINSNLIEIPTTPMHYNDATTSAKKAFSLVKENKILSKNILGCFYIPQLVFNVSETFLTLSTANVHATIGESCKTMNMLGRCDSKTGAQDYFNIEGAVEFSSDYTKIVLEVGGFDIFVEFVESKETVALKAEIIKVGRKMREASVAPSEIKKLEKKRGELLNTFRGRYYELGTEKTNSVKSFLSTVNKEIVSAKAMFLAYSDPFEKYRALLFEYAHTLGHGVEAFANLCYTQALEQGVDVPESAQRLHGQCVGMAVLMAGQMSSDLGQLQGDDFAMHQGLVYLFNRHGGFDFGPLRFLLDSLGVSKSDFCEGVLGVVRRDNKRGYIQCDDCRKSVDQLVTGRIGKMMRSTDKNAELRYLVEVDEDWQRKVLGMAFDGKFDKVADIDDEGKLRFREREQLRKGDKVLAASSSEVGEFLHDAIASVYASDVIAIISLPVYLFSISILHKVEEKTTSSIATDSEVAPSFSRLTVELLLGIFVYDLVFFFIHLLLHRSQFLYRNVHARHHTHQFLSVETTLSHSLFDGALQVSTNIFVQHLGLFCRGTKHRLSRLLLNVVITYMLCEIHSELEAQFSVHNLCPSICGGALRHRYHQAYTQSGFKGRKGVHYQEFFRYLDDYFGCAVTDEECRRVVYQMGS